MGHGLFSLCLRARICFAGWEKFRVMTCSSKLQERRDTGLRDSCRLYDRAFVLWTSLLSVFRFLIAGWEKVHVIMMFLPQGTGKKDDGTYADCTKGLSCYRLLFSLALDFLLLVRKKSRAIMLF